MGAILYGLRNGVALCRDHSRSTLQPFTSISQVVLRLGHLLACLITTVVYIQISFSNFSSIQVQVENAYNLNIPLFSNIFTQQQFMRLQPLVSSRSIRMLHISSSYGLFRKMTGMGVASGGQFGVGGMPASIVSR